MLGQRSTATAAPKARTSFSWLGLLLNLLWIGTLAVGLYYGYNSWHLTTQGNRIVGTVVQMISSEDDNGDYSYAPLVQYEVNGSTYTYESHNYTNPPAYQEGQQVQLLYDPARPDKARISNFLELWLLPFLMIPFALITAAVNLFVLPVFAARKRA